MVIAISKDRYEYVHLRLCSPESALTRPSSANNGGNCNQWIKIKNTANGKMATGQVRDSCPGCGYDDLGTSPHLLAPSRPALTLPQTSRPPSSRRSAASTTASSSPRGTSSTKRPRALAGPQPHRSRPVRRRRGTAPVPTRSRDAPRSLV